MKEHQTTPLLADRREMMRAFRDKNAEYDGVFFVAVKTTGIFCRPSCPSHPKPDNVGFFGSVKECLAAGYRPCQRCRPLETNLATMRKRQACAVVPGEHKWLTRLRRQLGEYFAGGRREFTVPLAQRGTAFQERVWRELRLISPGETISYEELARRIGQPSARRAVARANGMNRICILIPCHWVIGEDGSPTGYGGGLWRKRLLLELERTHRGAPQHAPFTSISPHLDRVAATA